MKSISDAINESKDIKRPKNLYTEFQEFGVYLAEQLGDPKHYSLYIKLAKQTDRKLLDESLTYAKGYTTANSKAKIFMWRLKQLKNTPTNGKI
jgi:hypothetical protein